MNPGPVASLATACWRGLGHTRHPLEVLARYDPLARSRVPLGGGVQLSFWCRAITTTLPSTESFIRLRRPASKCSALIFGTRDNVPQVATTGATPRFVNPRLPSLEPSVVSGEFLRLTGRQWGAPWRLGVPCESTRLGSRRKIGNTASAPRGSGGGVDAAGPTPAPPASGTPAQNRKTSNSMAILLRLVPFLWPSNIKQRARVVCAVGCLLASKLATIQAPALLGSVVDQLSHVGSKVPLADSVGSEATAGTVSSVLQTLAQMDPSIPLGIILGYAVARICSTAFNELRNALFSRVSYSACSVLACNSFKHLHSLDVDFLLLARAGELSTIFNRGIKAVSQLLSMMIFQVVPTIFEFGLVLAMLAWKIGPLAFGIMTATMICYVAFTIKITSWRTRFRKSMNLAEQKAGGILLDSLANVETIRLFSGESHELKRYAVFRENHKTANVKVAQSLAFLNFGQQTIFNMGLFCTMLLTASQIASGAVPVGHMAFVTALLFQLAIPLNMIGSVYRETKLNLVDLKKLNTLLNLEPKVKSMPNALPLKLRENGRIEFRDVHFEYRPQHELLMDIDLESSNNSKNMMPQQQGSQKSYEKSCWKPPTRGPVPIFRGLSFTLEPGTKNAIVGPSGSGKSTILKLLFRFYDPQTGEILFDGQNIANVDLDSFRKHIGVVPQDVILFNESILFNLMYGNFDAPMEKVVKAAKAAHIYDTIVSNFPDGFDTIVGERGVKLSGGEKQRIGIARCILSEPTILVFDEATSSLDSQTERRILDSFLSYAAGRTSLVIAHRLSTITDADCIFYIDNGRVVEQGSHSKLLQISNGRYLQLWRHQGSFENGSSSPAAINPST